MSKPPENIAADAECGECRHFPAYHDRSHGECRAWDPDQETFLCSCKGWKKPKVAFFSASDVTVLQPISDGDVTNG